jgi:hypothetical protein
MKGSALVYGALCLTLTGCAGPPWEGRERTVRVEDNVDGRSAANVQSRGGAVQVQVAQFAGGCRLRQFLVGPWSARQAVGDEAGGALTVRAPEVIEGGRASLSVWAPGVWVVRAQYVHSVLVDEGHKGEPSGDAPAWGEGNLRIGRPLGGGYRFDHVEFSSHVEGPGGASARIVHYPAPQSHDATMTVHWYYDEYSKVQFKWKIYAQGPCDTKPD